MLQLLVKGESQHWIAIAVFSAKAFVTRVGLEITNGIFEVTGIAHDR
ncbi:hypothetical protein [Nostoc sp. T09]|nr:hypothetical protein [Nostoc sp. T09]